MNMRSVIGVLVLVMGVVACGGQGAPEQAAAPAPSAQAPDLAESNTAAATTDSPAVDVAGLKACEIVNPQEAATIIGGKLLNGGVTTLRLLAHRHHHNVVEIAAQFALQLRNTDRSLLG